VAAMAADDMVTDEISGIVMAGGSLASPPAVAAESETDTAEPLLLANTASSSIAVYSNAAHPT